MFAYTNESNKNSKGMALDRAGPIEFKQTPQGNCTPFLVPLLLPSLVLSYESSVEQCPLSFPKVMVHFYVLLPF